jgi:membrane AbrB-like protein
MFGPIIALAIGTLCGLPELHIPVALRAPLQAIVGTYVGATVTREAALEIVRLRWALVVATAWTILAGVVIAYGVSQLTGMGFATALLGCAPGGSAEMTAIALSVNAEAAAVAALQILRLAAALAIVPVLARKAWRGLDSSLHVRAVELSLHATRSSAGSNGRPRPHSEGRLKVWLSQSWHATVALAIGAVGAWSFSVAGVPAGALSGSLMAVSAASIATKGLPRPPAPVRLLAQFGIGTIVGAGLSGEAVGLLLSQAPLFAVITAGTLVSSLVLARLLCRWLSMDATTALLACGPGGVAQLPLVADELGADPNKVMVFQLARVIFTILLIPPLLHAFLYLKLT